MFLVLGHLAKLNIFEIEFRKPVCCNDVVVVVYFQTVRVY
jgi:hypothetical protein